MARPLNDFIALTRVGDSAQMLVNWTQVAFIVEAGGHAIVHFKNVNETLAVIETFASIKTALGVI